MLPLALLACAPPADPPTVVSVGEDAGAGNLLSVQPWMRTRDYSTAYGFAEALDDVFAFAEQEGLLGDATVAVLPEYVGAWLVVLDEPPLVIGARTTKGAMTSLVLQHPFAFRAASASAPAEDATTHAIFSVKAERMAEVYVETMSGLAERYGVTLVAGSILLPGPAVEDGALTIEAGAPLANVALVFGPDGALLGQARKTRPTEHEQPFVEAGYVDELPVFDTPAGPLGVLVCADAWFPETWEALAARGAELVAVPVFSPGDGSWDATWGGYSGWPEPDDVELDDVGAITEGEAWAAYTVLRRAPESGARAAVSSPLRGELWDLGSDGKALYVAENDVSGATGAEVPLLLNLWLPPP